MPTLTPELRPLYETFVPSLQVKQEQVEQMLKIINEISEWSFAASTSVPAAEKLVEARTKVATIESDLRMGLRTGTVSYTKEQVFDAAKAVADAMNDANTQVQKKIRDTTKRAKAIATRIEAREELALAYQAVDALADAALDIATDALPPGMDSLAGVFKGVKASIAYCIEELQIQAEIKAIKPGEEFDIGRWDIEKMRIDDIERSMEVVYGFLNTIPKWSLVEPVVRGVVAPIIRERLERAIRIEESGGTGQDLMDFGQFMESVADRFGDSVKDGYVKVIINPAELLSMGVEAIVDRCTAQLLRLIDMEPGQSITGDQLKAACADLNMSFVPKSWATQAAATTPQPPTEPRTETMTEAEWEEAEPTATRARSGFQLGAHRGGGEDGETAETEAEDVVTVEADVVVVGGWYLDSAGVQVHVLSATSEFEGRQYVMAAPEGQEETPGYLYLDTLEFIPPSPADDATIDLTATEQAGDQSGGTDFQAYWHEARFTPTGYFYGGDFVEGTIRIDSGSYWFHADNGDAPVWVPDDAVDIEGVRIAGFCAV